MTDKPDNIFLTGFSTSGKTTLGKELAKKMNIKFFDTDVLIEKQEGRPIAEIFKNRGEGYFRVKESEIIRQVINIQGRKVIALGGGAYDSKANRDIIDSNGTVIYLSCSVSELYRRLNDKKDRPLLDFNGDKYHHRSSKIKMIRALLSKRNDNYLMAGYRVSTTSKSIALTVRQIIEKVKYAGNQG